MESEEEHSQLTPPLAAASSEKRPKNRGRLKVFFGMCPGVGKTYAMLQAARQLAASGTEVVVAIVETHGRKETEALIEGLAVVPRTTLEYRGVTLEEMDLDAVLLWHPALVLVDELAHSNVPGSRHPKRYQDVFELLEAGIDVFTTVNVQHLESRADAVAQITNTPIRERIPDSILDAADEITLVDLTPEQLRLRLSEGRVYTGPNAERAAEHFFRETNLMALREMSLRVVAEHVDRGLRENMQSQRIVGPNRSGERLLVGVSDGPFSEKLLRYTRRLATTMEASWVAVNIESTRTLLPAQLSQLTRNLSLARKLGAEVISTTGVEIASALLRIAVQENVSLIIVGKPMRPWLSLIHI
jgi:two-component system sensor histidine kinase KdpD